MTSRAGESEEDRRRRSEEKEKDTKKGQRPRGAFDGNKIKKDNSHTPSLFSKVTTDKRTDMHFVYKVSRSPGWHLSAVTATPE